MILQGRLPDTQVPHTPNTTQDTMLKKTHTSLPTVLPVKGKLHVPAYTRGTKGQETEEAEPKCERPPLRPLHGGSGSTVSDPPHASQPCAANEEWVYLRAHNPCRGEAGWGLGQMDTQGDGLGSPQTLQTCHTRVFRHHTNLVLSSACHAGKTPSSEPPVSQHPSFMWFFSSSPIVRNYSHDGEPCF